MLSLLVVRRACAMVMVSVAMAAGAQKGVVVKADEAAHRVDVTIDGTPFTSYLWDTNQRKPVLYPLIAPDGTTVTRGYPFAMRPGERVDHPHHAGLWFNYGNANGFDFWNNSDAIPVGAAAEVRDDHARPHRVREERQGCGRADGGVRRGRPARATRFSRRRRGMSFAARQSAAAPARGVDVTVTLKALSPVVFHDDKEGLMGLRVAHFLESPTEKGGVFMDSHGNPTQVAAADPAGATGVYRTSEGKTGDAAWGTRGAWCLLSGTTADGKAETIAILDNKANPGYPAYWHARGYGLFGVNPLGAHIFDSKAPAMNYSIATGDSATFKYRILIVSGAASDAEINKQASAFDAE